MDSTIDAAGLADCVAPLDEEDRAALRRYWDEVIGEVWSALHARPVPRPVPLAELDERRARRQARRAMARVAAAGRVAAVRELEPVAVATGEAA